MVLVVFGDKGMSSKTLAELGLRMLRFILVENHIIILENHTLFMRLWSLQMRIFLVEDPELIKPST